MVLTPAERERERLWKASVRAHRNHQREESRWAWIEHYDKMCEIHTSLAQLNKDRANALLLGDHTRARTPENGAASLTPDPPSDTDPASAADCHFPLRTMIKPDRQGEAGQPKIGELIEGGSEA